MRGQHEHRPVRRRTSGPLLLSTSTTDERRETLLRTAGLLDRLALAEPDDRALDVVAVRAGDELAAFDRLHGTGGGGGKELAGRAYTRRAHATWIVRPRGLPE
ncbi:hypothetical protein [Streptomyces sp. NPDC087294]|uniref:hypothetical protein n=1 Tax=Streptomyces sp. NPDC087294 TaxID=3365777 RepID=UPI003820F0FF